MLEKLDSIDWKALGSYPPGDPWNIPENIRRLLSDQPEVRQDALERLIDIGSHDTIWRPTPHIVPFLFELLDYGPTPDKAAIVAQLGYVLEEVAVMGATAIEIMRRYVAIYDSFKERLPLLLKLLDDPDEPLRLATLDVLSYMHDDTPTIEAVLLDRLQETHGESEALRMLQTLHRLWDPSTARPGGPQRTLLPLLQNLIDGHASPRVRAGAARLATFFPSQFEWRNDVLLQTVSTLLTGEFFAPTVKFGYESLSDMNSGALLAAILRLPNREQLLLDLLRNPAILAEQAHLAGSALVASAHRKAHYWASSLCRISYVRRKEGYFYYSLPYDFPEPQLNEQTRPILAQLMEIDIFWASPTNLFSFHYGLPDDRDELRALLNTQ